jgi:hypothetical protein
MKYLFLFVLLMNIKSAFSQTVTSKSYLLLRIVEDYDKYQQKPFFQIRAESGCDSASHIYALAKYQNARTAPDTLSEFYANAARPFKKSLYNYFSSPTEAMNYLSNTGWKLHSMSNEIFSSYTNESNGQTLFPVTTVSSRLVYCFEK